MFKSKLQELCQKKAWELPEYTSTKEGLDHTPRFSGTVKVNGLQFNTSEHFRSSKLAQNDAARLAFDHFSAPATSPIPSDFPQPGLISISPAGLPTGLQSEKTQEAHQAPQVSGFTTNVGSPASGNVTLVSATGSSSQINGKTSDVEDMQHLHKNQLMNYAQKRNLSLPVYSCEREGPPHATRFKCIVRIDGKTYQGQDYLPTVKDAEHAAAQVALMSLLPNGVQEDDSGLYKSLLQELLQKEFRLVPIYTTRASGEPHKSTFVSTVDIEGESFTGQAARTKKLAEVSAAKAAYNTLRDRKSSQRPLLLTPSSNRPKSLEFLSSNAPSDIAADRQQHASKILIPDSVSREKETEISAAGVGTSPQSATVSSGLGKRVVDGGSTSSGSGHARVLKASLLSAVPASQNAPSSTLPPDCASDLDSTLEPPTKRTTSFSNKVSVHPRMMNMTVPEDCAVLSISDENWVAVHEVRRHNI